MVEAGVRRTMNYMADLQRWGGWQCIYTWPTLLGSAAQGREYVDFDDYIDNDKGNGSAPLAAKFLWALPRGSGRRGVLGAWLSHDGTRDQAHR